MKKDSDLCLESKKHWKKMIKKIKRLSKEEESIIFDNTVYENFYDINVQRLIKAGKIIGESWGTADCALCIKFWSRGCDGCPLDMLEENCLNINSAWKSVNESTSKKEWLNNAENRILPVIERAYRYCLAIER